MAVDEKLIAKHAELATLWQRFLGSVIDNFILVLGILPVAIFMVILFPEWANEESTIAVSFVETIVITLALFALFAAVNFYLLQTRGQTVGKLIMGTQILSENDNLVPVHKILLMRYLIMWLLVSIPGIGRLINLANCVAVFRDNRKCLHDELCKTKVVQFKNATPSQ